MIKGLKNTIKAILVAILLITLFLVFRDNKAFANFMVDNITTPIKQFLGVVFEFAPFSVASVLVIALCIVVIWIVINGVCIAVKNRNFIYIVKSILSLVCLASYVWAGFCWLWGINYYADSFEDKSGLYSQPVSTQELYVTTKYFAEKVNETAQLVKRDENGIFNEDESDIFALSNNIYDNVTVEYPFLNSKKLEPKGVFISEIMSIIRCTGFFFPFTGEANVNVNSPSVFLPVIIAHELAHQKNIAPEQEANFVGIHTAVTSDVDMYEYSGYLYGYLHLGNALFSADRELWQEVSDSLCIEAKRDLQCNNEYWKKYESKVADVAEDNYTKFLESYGQDLGMKSYGACVDLLVAYYKDKI